MKKYISLFLLTVILVSCKSKQVVSPMVDESVTAKVIVERYSKNQLNFNTLHIKGNTKYGILSPSIDLRIKKDEMILVSVRVPIIAGTIVKAKVTPEHVSYYNNLESEYFEGDFDFLSNWLGTELDFQKLQNLLLGRTLDNPENENLRYAIENNMYKLYSERKNLSKAYYFESETYYLKKQFVEQKQQNRSASVEYSNYKNTSNNILPFVLIIKSLNEGSSNEFKVDYKSIEVNTEISFPYKIPDGYKEIQID